MTQTAAAAAGAAASAAVHFELDLTPGSTMTKN